jgi:hypothetical protein
MSDSFQGTAVIVWVQDSRQKFKMVNDDEELDKELERLRATVPDRLIFVFAVNWTSQEIMTFIGDGIEEVKN